MATAEPTVNTYLAQALRTMHPRWAAKGAIVSQATGVIVGDKGKQPDIMVRIPRAAPLVIEAEFYPARSLENDALSRVGAQTARVGCVLPRKISDGGLAAIAEPALAHFGPALTRCKPSLRRIGELPIPLAVLGALGSPGPVHRDINGMDKATGAYRGPFDIKPLLPGRTPSYPVLWAHDAGSGRESQIEVSPDEQGRVRAGIVARRRLQFSSMTVLGPRSSPVV